MSFQSTLPILPGSGLFSFWTCTEDCHVWQEWRCPGVDSVPWLVTAVNFSGWKISFLHLGENMHASNEVHVWCLIAVHADVQTAVVAKEALEGHCIYDGGFCKLHISYSRHTDLSIKVITSALWDDFCLENSRLSCTVDVHFLTLETKRKTPSPVLSVPV